MQSFVAHGVDIDAVSKVPVQRGPLFINYIETPTQPPAQLPPGSTVRARMVGEEPLPAPPPPKLAPTEEELRAELVHAVAVSEFCLDALARAAATHQRSVRHCERCRTRVESYASLDAEIAESTTEQLAEEHRPRIDLPDELRLRMTEREIAKSDLQTAERATATLAEALAVAKQDAERTKQAAERAAVAVTMVLAGTMAERILELEAEAQRMRALVLAADVPGVAVSQAMRTIQGDGSRYLRPVDRSAWAALRQRLMDDPQAPLALR